MLPKTTLVRTKKAIEWLYDGTCTITEYIATRKANKSTGHREVIKYVDIPCRLSYSSSQITEATQGASKRTQAIRLFTASEYDIKAGSKITVTQNGQTVGYKSASEPAKYQSHQEVNLELFDGWA